jgi:hypothetical protein
VITAATLGLAPAELAGDEDPFAMFGGWDSGQLVWLAILVPVAVLVFTVGSRRVRAQLRPSALGPRGRDHGVAGRGYPRDEAWRETVERLEARAPTPIARAQDGPVRIEGVITRSMGNLGGPAGRECVWRNRAGAGPQTAVASELLVVTDPTGSCGLEGLEQARVFAPVEKVGAHHEAMSLYVGDRIEIFGCFAREPEGQPDDDPTQHVHGTLGADGRLDVRVLERPATPAPTAEPHAQAAPPQTSTDDSTASHPPEPEP